MKNFKKILSYFILFFAFCLICIGIVNVKADTNTNFIYSNSVINDISNNQELYKNVANYIKNNASIFENQFNELDITNDKVILIYGGFSYSVGADGYVRVFMVPDTRNLTLTYNGGWYGLGFYSYDYRFTYNINTLEITGIDITPTSIISHSLSKSKNGNDLDFSYFYLDWHMGKNTTSLFENNTSDNIIANSTDLIVSPNSTYNLYQFAKNLDYQWYEEEQTSYCDPDDFLGQMSNISDFTITIKATTNALSYPILGSFDIISNKYMQSSDWNIDFSHTPDDIISTGSISCITNRCVFHFQAVVEDDIDEDVVLNYKFTPAVGVSMPTRIQLDTCNNNDLNVNFSYTYNLSDTNTNTNPDNTIITDDTNMNNWIQDGSLPDYSGLSDTSIIPDGPVDAILTLPLNVMNSLLNVLNSNTCQPLVLPIPFTNGQNLTLPCVSTLYSKINGLSTFLTWFSAIFSAFILYQYFINLYKWVDDTLTFRENNHFGGY